MRLIEYGRLLDVFFSVVIDHASFVLTSSSLNFWVCGKRIVYRFVAIGMLMISVFSSACASCSFGGVVVVMSTIVVVFEVMVASAKVVMAMECCVRVCVGA